MSVSDFSDVDLAQLPRPKDDGAAAHLGGMTLPSVSLAATSGKEIILAQLAGLTVLCAYPMTGRPG